jgi:hypothetical protein
MHYFPSRPGAPPTIWFTTIRTLGVMWTEFRECKRIMMVKRFTESGQSAIISEDYQYGR